MEHVPTAMFRTLVGISSTTNRYCSWNTAVVKNLPRFTRKKFTRAGEESRQDQCGTKNLLTLASIRTSPHTLILCSCTALI
ncbi:hypothetical protein E2C01_087192 [Portunus trituberculatus]|uniref:Uncharacterized protein n=1 Tax=Portunus trituberculatus TaxID=210409 RepID=A0A5B7J5Y7_PORTR|nr:hypothetical protein [Portunus trituberculatus]